MLGKVKLGLVGVGMFGGDVHLRAFAALQRNGLGGQLGRLGLDAWTRDFAPIQFELTALAARTEPSAVKARNQFASWTGMAPKTFWGETPWTEMLRSHPDLDVIAVATPDDLHTPVILAALEAGAHVITEKPMCLLMAEADQIISRAAEHGRLVGVDMHKRFDPDHRRIRDELLRQIGEPLYGTAYLEEPLSVSAGTFKWVERSDPFSYVGPHWVDLILHYFQSKPVSLTAVGQKSRLLAAGINAYDSVQVRVEFANGLSFNFHNNWITPTDFEGPVNQGHEIVGTHGKIESDQQYRGLRWWRQDGGSRTANTHFTREIRRPDGSSSCVGYGVDSLNAIMAAVCRVKFSGARPEEVAAIYPTAEEARLVVAVVHAARVVRDLNFDYLRAGKGAAVTARFGPDGITIVDPNATGEADRCRRVYSGPL